MSVGESVDQLLQLRVVACVGGDGVQLLQLCVEGDRGQLLHLGVGVCGGEGGVQLQLLQLRVAEGGGQLLQLWVCGLESLEQHQYLVMEGEHLLVWIGLGQLLVLPGLVALVVMHVLVLLLAGVHVPGDDGGAAVPEESQQEQDTLPS